MKVGVAIADISAGMFATVGVLAALREASATGVGQPRPGLALRRAARLAREPRQRTSSSPARSRERLGNAHPAIVPVRGFPRSDGHVIVAIGTDAQFARFCRAAALDELAADERFASNPAPRASTAPRSRRVLAAAIEPTSARRLARAVLERAGVPGRPRAHDPRGLRARALRDAGPRAPDARAAPPPSARRSGSTACAPRPTRPPRCSASTPPKCSQSWATAGPSARAYCLGPAAWPESGSRSDAVGGYLWVASPLPLRSSSSHGQRPYWPTDPVPAAVDWCSFPRNTNRGENWTGRHGNVCRQRRLRHVRTSPP